MQEARQNWHKYKHILRSIAPTERMTLALYSGNQIIAGANTKKDPKDPKYFSDMGMAMDHPENAWEVLAHKYNSRSVSFAEREALLSSLGELQKQKIPFTRQIEELKRQLLYPQGSKAKSFLNFGEKNNLQCLPRRHFILKFFDPFFSDLLPERKVLLLVIQKSDPKRLETIALEFCGKELKNFCEPDWTGMDLINLDIFHRESAERMVLWCENHFLLPCFGLFVTSHVWEEAINISRRQGNRGAWKYLAKQYGQRDSDKEFLLEPEPWPLKAGLHWLAFKG